MSNLVPSGDAGLNLGAFRLARGGLTVDGTPTYEEWERAGQAIRYMEGSVMWWVGDWLNYGEATYGEAYAQAVETTGLTYQTVADAKWIAKAVRFSSRKESLTFGHHRVIAALPPESQAELLGEAERERLTIKQLTALVQKHNAALAVASAEAEGGCTTDDLWSLVRAGRTFGTVYADPPWQYDNQGTRAATDNHYVTMTVDELAELPVGQLAAPASHLWLWTTNGFIRESFRLFDAWGFEFKSSYVWCKPQMGIGNYLRNAHEFLLLGTKGGLVGAAKDVMSWGVFPRTRHSAKPHDIRRDVVERVSPGPRLELFGRETVPGWSVWGNEIARDLFDTVGE
jgi:N6-adenosine-specific RNA methylase IME4